MSRHPLVKWAQMPDQLFITVELPDAKNVKVNLVPEGKFSFSATSGADDIPYEIDIDLYDKIDVDESKVNVTPRHIVYLVKKAESKWWSRLLKQERKPPVYLKVDWDKWVDEDDEMPAGGMNFGDLDISKLNMGGGEDFDAEEADGDEDDESGTDKEGTKKEEGATTSGATTADGRPEAAPVATS